MTVRLHIERLVLDGFAVTGAEGACVRAALESELIERLAAEPPASWADLAVPTLTFEPIKLPEQPGPGRLGRAAGAALHGGLRR